MALIYKLTRDGGFLAGNTETDRTAYAYPSSPHARAALRKPEAVAREMLLLPEYPPYNEADRLGREAENKRRWDILLLRSGEG